LGKEIKKFQEKVDEFEMSFRAEKLREDVKAKFVLVSGVRYTCTMILGCMQLDSGEFYD
jgi:hypothetical protein